MDFRSFLRSKREALGISQNKFAKLVGITQSYYNGVERGEIKNPPSEEIIEKFVTTLLLTPEEGDKLKYLAAIERTPSIILERTTKAQRRKNPGPSKSCKRTIR